MKKLISTLTLLIGVSSAFAVDIPVTSDITTDTMWTADNAYILGKPIFVKNGATLTIEPGTTVYGYEDVPNSSFGSLVITRGCKLMAEGTPTKPIVFTALAERDGVALQGGGTRPIELTDVSLWGGVILLGQAILNTPDNPIINPTAPVIGTFKIEGFPAEGGADDITYGGDNDDDNSGVLRFVSIRYGGFEFQQDEEINGLSLGAVGRGTTIEFVEVFNNSDDGVELFGGTVNLKYMVMAFNEDESFDWDQGWRGKGQFWFAIQKDVGNGSNYGAEMDGGDGADKTLMPYAIPMIYNATYIGSGVGGSNPQDNATWRMKDNTGGFYYNSIFTDYKDYAIRIDDDTTKAQYAAGNLSNGGNMFGAFGAWDGTVASLARSGGAEELGMLAGMNNSNSVLGDQIVVESISREKDGKLDPRILDLDGPAYDTATMMALPDNDTFYSIADHKGAIGSFNWLKGWTYLDSEGYMDTSVAAQDTSAEFGNLSTRGLVGTGTNEEMILGFVISGLEPQTVYITGKGPSLSSLASPLADPKLTLVDPTDNNSVIATNTSWKNSAERGLIEATTIPPTDDKEAAIVVTLPPGSYTVLLESETAAGGVAIGEVYLYR
jgi:trimeric autotransporter adhesin